MFTHLEAIGHQWALSRLGNELLNGGVDSSCCFSHEHMNGSSSSIIVHFYPPLLPSLSVTLSSGKYKAVNKGKALDEKWEKNLRE